MEESVVMSQEPLPNDSWMVRPCEIYKEELRDCSNYKGRFHQYFVDGTLSDCKQWEKDFDNCMTWRKQQDLDALNNVIASEKQRITERLKSTLANDVWQLRTEPLSAQEWNRPLPEWMTKRNANSYLEVVKTNSAGSSNNRESCTIL